MSINIGCYIISRDNAEEIITCLQAQECLATSVMLAIDSKASDETIAVIESMKHSYLPDLAIYRQEWRDNFAWARNDCLCKMLEKFPTLDYVYWVDSDDVWDNSIDFSQLKNRLEKDSPNSVILPYEYLGGIVLNRRRFWKIVEGPYSPYCWIGAAHEVESLVVPELAGEVVWENYKLIHNKTETPEESTAKRIRNIKILSKSLEEDSANVRDRFYLSREYYNHGDYDNAIIHYDVYLKQSNNIPEKYQAYLDLMYIYTHLKEYDKAIDAGHSAIELYPNVAFAATLLGDVYRIQEKWALAAVWYEYAVNSPHAPVIFDFVNLRTIAPLRWLSVACQRLGRMDDAYFYHMECGNCEIQDGLQERNSIWLFNNKYIPRYLEAHFKATEKIIDNNEYMIVKNFNDSNVKTNIKAILDYNSEMAIVRILEEGTSDAKAVIFKGYNDFKEMMTEEEKEKIRNYTYEDLVHPAQFTLFENFYKIAVELTVKRNEYKPITIVELGSDQGLSSRFFIKYPEHELEKITFIDTNLHKNLFPLIDNKKTFFIQDLAENAVEQFEDESIDLLHVDTAPHTYEAQKNQFELFLPKLKKTAVIIFHDVGLSRDHNFTGRKVLEELRYPWVVCYNPEGVGLPDVSPGLCYRIDY